MVLNAEQNMMFWLHFLKTLSWIFHPHIEVFAFHWSIRHLFWTMWENIIIFSSKISIVHKNDFPGNTNHCPRKIFQKSLKWMNNHVSFQNHMGKRWKMCCESTKINTNQHKRAKSSAFWATMFWSIENVILSQRVMTWNECVIQIPFSKLHLK